MDVVRSSMLHVGDSRDSIARYVRGGEKPGLEGDGSRPERDGADESEDRRDRGAGRGRGRDGLNSAGRLAVGLDDLGQPQVVQGAPSKLAEF